MAVGGTDGTRNLSSADTYYYPPTRYEDVKFNGSIPPAGARKLISKPIKAGSGAAGKLAISYPIIPDANRMENPLSRIPTIDLATAVENDRRRRAANPESVSYLVADSAAPLPPSFPSTVPLSMAMNDKKNDTAQADLSRTDSGKSTQTGEMLSVQGNALSSSAQLSPGADALRRRSPRNTQPSSTTKAFEAIRPGEPIRIPIPQPPKTASESSSESSEKSQETAKTPLQRRPTNGLPSNPRAPAMKDAAKHGRSKTEQTVMLMNNITYNDPSAAIGALDRANTMPLDSRSSVVHRPRPIPRKSDKDDRQVFPAEISPAHSHRRVKSSGSIISKRSILKSRPGSPTELPPLPPPPKSAGAPSRPLPNNTKSMTFDEKMELFYAPPLSALPGAHDDKRSSEVDTHSRRSIATSHSSVQTADVFEVSGETRQLAPKTDPVESSQPPIPPMPPMPVSRWSDDPSQVDTQRRSSPVLPYRQSNMSTARDDDAMTNWGSVHSPVAAVHVRQARLNARSTYIQKDLREAEEHNQNIPSFNNQSGEVVTVMLDTFPSEIQQPSKPDQEKVATLAQKRRTSRQFHRRVGDECPTFSGRSRAQSRKMPPPAPLLLSMRSGKKAVVVQSAEPSPLESPEVAYQMIQDQLRKLEDLNEEDDKIEGDRMTLLENLELEMAGQQNKWQTLQMNIQRDSMSTVMTSSPSRGSRPTSTVAALSQEQSQRFLSPDHMSSRKSSRLSGSTTLSRKDVPELIMKHNNMNILAVSKAALGSPSPPDTDESDSEMETEQIPQALDVNESRTTSPRELWKPKPIATAPGNVVGLWETSPALLQDFELPGLSIRPKIRKTLEPLSIESSRMWERAMWMSELNPTSGLWQKRIPIERQQTQKVASRPLTIRPPRKSKRFTQLPDILESPEPLDKRGTLGIFRFPTGEKSESATVQYRPSQMFMAMPGTMTTGAPAINAILQARAQELADAEPYSYFDEFDEESGDNFDDFSDSEDIGDEFDETTLWEIANLLKSENVPSRDSLMAASFSPSERVDSLVLEESVYDGQSDEESDDASVVDFEIVSEESTPTHNSPVVFFKPTSVRPSLWSHGTCSETNFFGLPQPDTEVWNAYMVETGEESRSRSYTSEILPIHSTSLWMPSSKESNASSIGLWTKPSAVNSAEMKSSSRTPANVPLMWSEPSLPPKSPLAGLFNTMSRRSNYRTTSAEPAALYMTRTPRTIQEPLQQLTTTSLWGVSKSGVVKAESSMKQASKPRNVTSKLMWTKPTVVASKVSGGLFDVRSKRLDYRRTSQPPAALSMTRKPSTRKEPVAELTSRNLWSAQALSKPTLTSGKPSLWTKTIAPTPAAPGLFKVDPKRKVYRTTTAEPAAVQMDRKPRTLQSSLPELESSSLWTVGRQASVELDWLSISSTRPRSPSIASVSTDSTSSSPVSDVFSVKTNVTKASSVAESTKKGKGFLGGWFGKGKKEKVPEVPEVPRLPEGLMIKNLDNVAPEKPARVPLRKLYHPDTVYPADWDAALREAVAASRSAKRVISRDSAYMARKKTVPPAEWDAQLYQAIQASRIQCRPTRIMASPQQWSAALKTAAAASYPPKKSTEDEETNSSLWTRPAALPTGAPKGLWTATSATGVDVSSLPELSSVPRPQRSRASSESTRLPSTVEVSSEFHSQSLWREWDHSASKRGFFRAHARDWLEDTTKRRFSRLELRY